MLREIQKGPSGPERRRPIITAAQPEAINALSLPTSAVIFLGNPQVSREEALRQQRLAVVPWEMRIAGAALDTLITAHPEQGGNFVNQSSIPTDTLDRFRHGDAITDLNGVYRDAFSSFGENGAEQLLIIDRSRQNQNWLRTFTQKDMTVAISTELMILNTGLTYSKFAEEAQRAEAGLTRCLNGTAYPILSTANDFLRVAGVDPDSMAAQYYRLASRKRKPLSINELQTISLGELIQRLRVMKGLDVEQLGDLLGYNEPSMHAVEGGRNRLKQESFAPLIGWLGLPKGSALVKIIEHKFNNQPRPDRRKTQPPQAPPPLIPEGVIEDVLLEKYLFQEHIDQIKMQPYPITEREEKIKTELEEMGDSTAMLKRVREREGVTPQQLADGVGVTIDAVQQLESRENILDGTTIMFYLSYIGGHNAGPLEKYDVHHPITQLILSQAEAERNIKAEANEATRGIKRRPKKRQMRPDTT